jgi:LytS/YehU family sensor histidine kinase
MRAAEVERAHAARRTLESRLQAMQARVEPQFLFNTLAQVRDLYRSSATRGERMLEELIAYLRAAMPRMRDTSSTVGQEVELARAYLGIVSLRLGERLAFDVEPPAGAADARMPPMMLLPLVDHAIAHGLADPQSSGSIRIRTAISDETVRLEIVDSGVGFLPGTDDGNIAAIRERLSALYGNDASLVLRRKETSATEAVLELRYEPALATVGEGA